MHAAWQYGMTLMCSAQPVCNSMQLSAACSATHVRAMFVNMRADAHACNSMQTYSLKCMCMRLCLLTHNFQPLGCMPHMLSKLYLHVSLAVCDTVCCRSAALAEALQRKQEL
jgi:hypothetical protein